MFWLLLKMSLAGCTDRQVKWRAAYNDVLNTNSFQFSFYNESHEFSIKKSLRVLESCVSLIKCTFSSGSHIIIFKSIASAVLYILRVVLYGWRYGDQNLM